MLKKQELKIIVDNREKKPLWTSGTIIKRLETGDYSISINGESLEKKICIERKNGIDLFNTLSKGHARFNKEINRSKELEYFAIVIENSYEDLLNKRFKGSFYTKMKGHVTIAILLTIHMKYETPIFFTNSRKESRSLIKELFKTYIRKTKTL